MSEKSTTRTPGAFHEFIFYPERVQNHGGIETGNTGTKDTNRECLDRCRDVTIGSRKAGRNERPGTLGIGVLIEEFLDRFFTRLGECLRTSIKWRRGLRSVKAHALNDVDSDDPVSKPLVQENNTRKTETDESSYSGAPATCCVAC